MLYILNARLYVHSKQVSKQKSGAPPSLLEEDFLPRQQKGGKF